jgi:hypothetical protein
VADLALGLFQWLALFERQNARQVVEMRDHEAVPGFQKRGTLGARLSAQAGYASAAAAMAARVSSRPKFGTVPRAVCVAGSITSIVFPESAPPQWPPIKPCWRKRFLSLSFRMSHPSPKISR